VADEVVLERPLHDDGNGVATLVIQSAVKGVVKPLIGGFSLRLGERLLRLLRIIDQNNVGCRVRSAHRRCEVASR
jgi:hypothetical protein